MVSLKNRSVGLSCGFPLGAGFLLHLERETAHNRPTNIHSRRRTSQLLLWIHIFTGHRTLVGHQNRLQKGMASIHDFCRLIDLMYTEFGINRICLAFILSDYYRVLSRGSISGDAWYDGHMGAAVRKVKIDFNLCHGLFCWNMHFISHFWPFDWGLWLAFCILFHWGCWMFVVSFLELFSLWFTRIASLVSIIFTQEFQRIENLWTSVYDQEF